MHTDSPHNPELVCPKCGAVVGDTENEEPAEVPVTLKSSVEPEVDE